MNAATSEGSHGHNKLEDGNKVSSLRKLWNVLKNKIYELAKISCVGFF